MNATTDLGPLLTAADPLHGTDAELPALTAEIVAARAAGGRTRPAPARPTRRRPVLLGSAVVGLAAAVTVAAVVIPSSTPGAADHASAQELAHVLDSVRTAPPLPYSTSVFRMREIDQVATTTGYATYRQSTIRTVTVSAGGTRYRYAFGRPRWLTPGDAVRAEHITDPHRPQRGISYLHDAPCRAGHGRYCLTEAYLASLPTTASALAVRLEADVGTRGGCAAGPGCQIENLMPLLFAPGASGPLRAAALELLGRSPGVTLLGDRMVDGRKGFAFRSEYGEDGLPVALVVDVHDGTELAQYEYSTASYWPSATPPVPTGSRVGSETRLG